MGILSNLVSNLKQTVQYIVVIYTFTPAQNNSQFLDNKGVLKPLLKPLMNIFTQCNILTNVRLGISICNSEQGGNLIIGKGLIPSHYLPDKPSELMDLLAADKQVVLIVKHCTISFA